MKTCYVSLYTLNASLPEAMQMVRTLDNEFEINVAAPKHMEATPYCGSEISDFEANRLGADARLIAFDTRGTDQAIWLMTQAGEFIKTTGEGSETRSYVIAPSDARKQLQCLEPFAIEVLARLNLFPSIDSSLLS